MKIVHCPKGGKVPENYCRLSCLNYTGRHVKANPSFLKKVGKPFVRKGRHVGRPGNDEIAY
jgi:hypothetical protein